MQKQESTEFRDTGIDPATYDSDGKRYGGNCAPASKLRSSAQEQRSQLGLRHRLVPDRRPDLRFDAAGFTGTPGRHCRSNEREGALGLPPAAQLPGRATGEIGQALTRQRHRPRCDFSPAKGLLLATTRVGWSARVAVVVNLVGRTEPRSGLKGIQVRTGSAVKKGFEVLVEHFATLIPRWILDGLNRILPALCKISLSGVSSGAEQGIHPDPDIKCQMRSEGRQQSFLCFQGTPARSPPRRFPVLSFPGLFDIRLLCLVP